MKVHSYMYNKLPKDIKETRNVFQFKKLLQHHIIQGKHMNIM